MDFGFENTGSGFSDFDVDVEEFVVKRTKDFDRQWRIGFGGSTPFKKVHDGVVYFGACDNTFGPFQCFDCGMIPSH